MTTERVRRLELVAAVLYGRDENGHPRAGWMSALARDMGVRKATVTATVNSEAQTSLFDRRLSDHIDSVVIPHMTADLEALKEISMEMQNSNGVVGLDEMMSLLKKHGVELPSIKDMASAKKGKTK